MNNLMWTQVTNALATLKPLDKSIDFAAMQDDGIVSKAERKQVKKIRKAIKRFERDMAKLKDLDK